MSSAGRNCKPISAIPGNASTPGLSPLLRFVLLAVMFVTLSACGGGGGGGSGGAGATGPELLTIDITPQTVTLAKGLSQQMTATGTYDDASTEDLTASVTWAVLSAGDGGAATIGADGLVEGTATGLVLITATSGTVIGAAVFTVTPEELVSLAVTPAPVSVAKGLPQPFTATATYTDGSNKNLTESADWTVTIPGGSSGNATITSGEVSGNGIASTLAEGEVHITASATEPATSITYTDTVVMTITPKEVVELVIFATYPYAGVQPYKLAFNKDGQFVARAKYTDNSTAYLTETVDWTVTIPAGGSGNATITSGEVSGNGLVSTLAVGEVLIGANDASSGFSDQVSLTISAGDIVDVYMGAAGIYAPIESSSQFTALAKYDDDSVAPIGTDLIWGVTTVAEGGDAIVDANGLVTTTGTGLADLSVTHTPTGFGSTAYLNIRAAWAWVDGSKDVAVNGVYGSKGVADAANWPGSRYGSVTWTDASDNLWLFGGNGYDISNIFEVQMNDLWKYDGTNWTWVYGANTGGAAASYGSQGVAAASNDPGARTSAVSWIDASGNLWLFGGRGSSGTTFLNNDLWMFNGSNWVWISGNNGPDQAGTYGSKGIAAAANVPGARMEAVSWSDGAGNLWLFGGKGLDKDGTEGVLNDLWRWDGSNWTWISGSDTVDQAGVYGSRGVADPANVPGARKRAVGVTDGAGNFWLFGGMNVDSSIAVGWLNDLWKFDGTNWTWVAGSNTTMQKGTYNSQGTPDPTSVPGARINASGWVDDIDNIWIFSGIGKDQNGTNGYLNDLWKFDGVNWAWYSGSSTISPIANWGTQDVPGLVARPPALRNALIWQTSDNQAWVFGGNGVSDPTWGVFNDLWRFHF